MSNVLVLYCHRRQAWHAYVADFGISRKLPAAAHVSKSTERFRRLPEVEYIAAEWANYREKLIRDPCTAVPSVERMTVPYTVAGDVYDFGREIYSAVLDWDILAVLRKEGMLDLWRSLTGSMRDCKSEDPELRPTFASLLEYFDHWILKLNTGYTSKPPMPPTGATTAV